MAGDSGKRGILLYGANGYTGRLIAEAAAARGIAMTLAGRNANAVAEVASGLGLPHVASSLGLDDPRALAAALEPFAAVLLAAGPFSATSAPVFEACLAARTSYLDITGEIDVFEALFARAGDAERAGVTVLPGAGFDVVPSDCLAAMLAEKLPDADTLQLAFKGLAPSAGTLKTMIEGLPKGGRVRRAGELVRVPVAWKTLDVPFAGETRLAMTIPWGDLATAWRSTGIPNIETYMAMPPAAIAAARRTRLLAPLLGLAPVQAILKSRAAKTAHPPDAEARRRGRSLLWGRVTSRGGTSVEGTLVTLEGYALTAVTAAESARRVADGRVRPGVVTPSQAFGARYITEFPETVFRLV